MSESRPREWRPRGRRGHEGWRPRGRRGHEGLNAPSAPRRAPGQQRAPGPRGDRLRLTAGASGSAAVYVGAHVEMLPRAWTTICELMERKWWTLIVVCIATFMLLVDITIVNVALPKIASDLK